MREIDDAHDAEHEIEPEPDEGEIQAEEQSGEQRIRQHAGAPAGSNAPNKHRTLFDSERAAVSSLTS